MAGRANTGAKLLLIAVVGVMTACKTSPMAQVQPVANSGLPTATKSGARTPKVPTSISVPAGTPVSVRLQQPLSSETAHAGQRFAAVLDEPLVANGVTVATKGTAVTGRVLAVRRSGAMRSGGVLQLALESLSIGAINVAIQTSSVIAGGVSPHRVPQSEDRLYGRGSHASVGAQRRLTFRLRQAVLLPANGQERTPLS